MKPTLLILAAGMGSRYGSLKQMDGVGPNNEAILEYSVFDAIRSGFGKVVFVIREDFEQDFKDKFHSLFADKIRVEYVYQAINSPIKGIDKLPERQKPWGTAHATLMAADRINEPFLMINADDYYGVGAFQTMSDFLTKDCSENLYSLVGYKVKNTLSENGGVSRGIITPDANGNVKTIIETHSIAKGKFGRIYYPNGDGKGFYIKEDTLVSMNYFGFHHSIFEHIRTQFLDFVEENKENPKAEFYIPFVVTNLIETGKLNAKVLSSDDNWYGVTYKEDKETVKKAFRELVQKGVYPNKLW